MQPEDTVEEFRDHTPPSLIPPAPAELPGTFKEVLPMGFPQLPWRAENDVIRTTIKSANGQIVASYVGPVEAAHIVKAMNTMYTNYPTETHVA